MKNIIVLAIAFVTLTGCATARMEARLDQIERENSQLRRQNAVLTRQQARTTTVVAPGQKAVVAAPAPGQRVTITAPLEKVSPDIDPSQPVVTTSTISTFVESNPGAFHCFMDRNPGFGGEWVKIPNRTRKYWVSMRINSQPLIVMRPVPGGWQPYYARRDVTVLPPGKVCYAWVPQGRMKPNGDLEEYQLEADAYFPSFQNGWRVLLSENRASYFPYNHDTNSLSRFNLQPGGVTAYIYVDEAEFK